MDDRYILERAVICIGLHVSDRVHHVHPFDNVPEYRIVAVKAGLKRTVVYEIDEELGATAVGQPGVGHGDCAGAVCFVGRLVLDCITRSAHAGTGGVSTLDHEAADDPVEDCSVIEALIDKGLEVPGSDRHRRIECDGNVAHRGLKQHLPARQRCGVCHGCRCCCRGGNC